MDAHSHLRAWPIGGWAVAALLLNSSCLAPAGQPTPDAGDAGEVQAGCGDGGACPEGESCDPFDGTCRCGPEAGDDGGLRGAFCGPNEICDPSLHTCVAATCYRVLCSDGNICDLADGLCKCGGVICPGNGTCDTTSHLCQ